MTTCLLAGYDPYAGYYNADGTAYVYDPNAYTAPEASAATAESAPAAAPNTDSAAVADLAAAAGPATATPAEAVMVAPANDTPAIALPVSADQDVTNPTDTSWLSGEHAANLLSVDEKASLEQQQEAAEVARKEAEARFQKAEEQRRNAMVLLEIVVSCVRSCC